MSATSNPRINISLLPAAIVSAFADRRDLLVGVVPTAATATTGALVSNVNSLTLAQKRAQFGTGELFNRVQKWLASNAGNSPLDVIAVKENGAGTAATASIAFTGPATAAGSITVSAVDEFLFTVTVQVAVGDTATVIGAAVSTALNALVDAPFTSAAVTGTVTITADEKGTSGNYYGLKISSILPAGVGQTLTGWAGGLTDPVLTTLFDVITSIRYTGISFPEYWQANLSLVKTLLEARFNAANDIIDGTAFHGRSLTYANALTAVSTENSQTIVMGGNNKITTLNQIGPAILQPADWTLAYFMGVRARLLTPGAPIASFIVTTSGLLDTFGGPALASLPYFNTPLAQTPLASPAILYATAEQRDLETQGFTTFGVNISNNAMIMGPTATNWKTDASGNANISFHYLDYVDTGSACREIFWRTLRSTFAQSRLTEGDLIPGRSMANAESIKSELLRIYRVLAGQALTQAGDAAEKYFSDNTKVTISLATGAATITGPLPIVTQLRQLDYALQFSFSVGSTGTQVTF
jgi:phage tail sheath gpL-like